ncbi:uncharacterized protein LOC115214407 isoform X1 [Octopus sinensis]|uniref:Uncharacterized protein LOC115214407 isoform X1 n=1 Tax=Octopus sinensis TaxID=2607531 RepID=A0A6P7SM12_9MOLL|nr:uncharacterized protein LOC115214407 isoform X1 [Octopus sinensis]
MADSDESLQDNELFTLKSFLDNFDLPQTVFVVSPGNCQTTPAVEEGQWLRLYKTVIPRVLLTPCKADDECEWDTHCDPSAKTPVTDHDTIEVPIDYPARYVVLSPPHDEQEPDAIYETINDLIKVSPPLFKANCSSCFSQQSFIGEIQKNNFEAGDTFKFLKIVRDGYFGKYLQCQHQDGRIMELPWSCKGDFSYVVDSNTTYTVEQLLEANRMPRYLWQADELVDHSNYQDSIVRVGIDSPSKVFTDDPFFNDDSIDMSESYFANQRNSFRSAKLSGRNIIYMDIPEIFVQVYHTSDPTDTVDADPTRNGESDVRWLIPLSSDMLVKCISIPDYEHPKNYKARRTLWEVASEHTRPLIFFPVLAQIVSYPDLPSEFATYLKPKSQIVVRRVEHIDKILARTEDRFFIIGPNLYKSFSALPRRFRNVSELSICKAGCELQVLEDVATDFPKPISLNKGDIIRIPNFQTVVYKFGGGDYKMECKVLRCEKLNSRGKYEKLKIPVDLEIDLIEMIANEDRERWFVSELFYRRPKLPLDVEAGDFYPTVSADTVLTLENFVRDTVVVVSNTKDSQTESTFSNQVCIEIPSRYKMVLDLKQDTVLPTDFTSPVERIALDAEELFEETYFYMETYHLRFQSMDCLRDSAQHHMSSRSVWRRDLNIVPQLSNMRRSLSTFSVNKANKLRKSFSRMRKKKYPSQGLIRSEVRRAESDFNIYENIRIDNLLTTPMLTTASISAPTPIPTTSTTTSTTTPATASNASTTPTGDYPSLSNRTSTTQPNVYITRTSSGQISDTESNPYEDVVIRTREQPAIPKKKPTSKFKNPFKFLKKFSKRS